MKQHSIRNMKISKGRMYEILRRPVITEKATLHNENNQIGFYVPLDSNKFEIRKAVETIFKVKVVSVNTVLTKGKKKIFKNRIGYRSDYKKAMVKLAEGESVDIMTGV